MTGKIIKTEATDKTEEFLNDGNTIQQTVKNNIRLKIKDALGSNKNAVGAEKINYDDIGLYSSKDLAKILGVDGIISGSIHLNVLLSQGIEEEVSIGDFLFFDSDFGRIAVKISDGITGKLLWKYDKAITRKGGKNTIEFIDSMMKKASRNFPYDKN